MKKEILKILIEEYNRFADEETELHFDADLSFRAFITWLESSKDYE